MDPRLLSVVSPAVAKAAIESGVSRRPIENWEAYTDYLRSLSAQCSSAANHTELLQSREALNAIANKLGYKMTQL
jgi:malate dehydrogenase (oxaloacetate-decarboxylating)(NADP+)